MGNGNFKRFLTLGLILLSFCIVEPHAGAQQQGPCYANQCYTVFRHCPSSCLVEEDMICFDEEGIPDVFEEYICDRLKVEVNKNSFFASYDCDDDGKADASLVLKFEKCDGEACVRLIGSYKFVDVDEVGWEEEKTRCTLVGY